MTNYLCPFSDINECERNISGCSHVCTDISGSFSCSCPDGYKLTTNQKTCESNQSKKCLQNYSSTIYKSLIDIGHVLKNVMFPHSFVISFICHSSVLDMSMFAMAFKLLNKFCINNCLIWI